MGGYAWVTLATNDAYSLGALVLAHSLRRVGTKYELACLVTPGVTAVMREKLAAVFSFVQEVNVLDSKDEANLALLARPELGITFTKLHCWRLTQYEKCVFVDADTLVVRNCDELFEREELSAAPDVGWPDCFNSGVFVFRPSQQTFASITAFAAAKGSFDGGDQGLLNMYFSDWATKDISKHLPFIYNMCSTATYSYLPAFKQFGEDVRIIHFIGVTKPWLQYFDTLTGIVQPPPGSAHLQPLLQLWWNIFCEHVHPQLSTSMAGIAGALAQITLGEARSAAQVALEEHLRKQSWEQGQIDYMGRDSFDNIWKKICETLSLAPQRQPTPPKEEDTATSKESTALAESAPAESAPADVEVTKPAVEADKDPTQPLICQLPEEKLPAAQITEQKASEESIASQEATAKVSSELSQPATGDVCARPTTESKSTELLEAGTVSAETIAEQYKLPSLAVLPEAAPQDKSLPLESKGTDLQASTCPPSADAVCKPAVQETVMAVAQADSALPSTEAKPEAPTSTVQAAVLPASIGADSPQKVVASPDLTQPLTIDPSEQHAEMLLAASEVSTVSPVPIQVAESVLQAEPKESVSGAAVSDQAIATTVTAVHESTSVAPVATTAEAVQLNGSACEVKKPGDAAPVSAVKADAPAVELTEQPASDVATIKDASSEAPLVAEKVESGSGEVPPKGSPATVEKSAEPASTAAVEVAQIAKTEAAEAKPAEQVAKTEAAEAKPAEQIAKIETKEEKSPEQVVKAESTEAKPIEPAKATEAAAATAISQSGVLESPIAAQAPPTTESVEAKELNIPSTPTVIEATPPISPLAESAQELEEKAAKKSLKKSDSADGTEGEGEDKKAKKTVKKTVKKSKAKPEEAASSAAVAESAAPAESSQSKAKKSVKVTKKTGLKSGQSLETDTSVPETPPPPSPVSTAAPDVPVPPKRKTKGSTSGTSAKGPTGKKPEAEE
ncbi:proteoglycan 4 isoform X3 [Ooceraea biroi]|uniref:proteoglycan 4 isoform X3 n=1 Tax=Ooceraea biroi TaxID=2015173 RepID=UPI000F086D41|nr:proteoglycan 4 isoform X3 [Ooceraea biroi]